jgi:hypothetical protein
MERWLNRKLDELDREDLDRQNEEMRAANVNTKFDELVTWMKADGPEVREAERGNMEPLHKKYPHLAKFLFLPKQSGKGKNFPKPEPLFAAVSDSQLWDLTQAVWDAARIRIIWKRHYETGPQNYASPEEIAARRWNVDVVERVHKWKKSRLCPQDPYRRAK